MGLLQRRMYGPTHRSSHAMVVEELGKAIVAGELSEGSILPGDQELMVRFDVSRTVLREAMKTLSAKRLIEAKARVGTRVRERDDWNMLDADVIDWRLREGIDAPFVTQLADMRQALEPAMAALAARYASNEEIVALYAITARFDDPAHTRESIAQVDLEFHLAVARMSRNPFMRSASSLIEAALAVAFQTSSPALSFEGIARCAVDHLKIAHAIASRNEDQARLTMQHVINEGLTRTIAALSRDGA